MRKDSGPNLPPFPSSYRASGLLLHVTSLGYPVTYAIANVLLTVWGPVVVAFVHAWRH